MKLINLKLRLIKIFNASSVFIKDNTQIFVDQIKKVNIGIPINKNLPSEKKLLAMIVLITIIFFWVLSYPFISLNVDKKNAFLEVKKGDNISQIANKLVKRNVLSDIFRFKLLAKLSNRSENIKSGHYFLKYNISPYELLLLLESGDGRCRRRLAAGKGGRAAAHQTSRAEFDSPVARREPREAHVAPREHRAREPRLSLLEHNQFELAC